MSARSNFKEQFQAQPNNQAQKSETVTDAKSSVHHHHSHHHHTQISGPTATHPQDSLNSNILTSNQNLTSSSKKGRNEGKITTPNNASGSFEKSGRNHHANTFVYVRKTDEDHQPDQIISTEGIKGADSGQKKREKAIYVAKQAPNQQEKVKQKAQTVYIRKAVQLCDEMSANSNGLANQGVSNGTVEKKEISKPIKKENNRYKNVANHDGDVRDSQGKVEEQEGQNQNKDGQQKPLVSDSLNQLPRRTRFAEESVSTIINGDSASQAQQSKLKRFQSEIRSNRAHVEFKVVYIPKGKKDANKDGTTNIQKQQEQRAKEISTLRLNNEYLTKAVAHREELEQKKKFKMTALTKEQIKAHKILLESRKNHSTVVTKPLSQIATKGWDGLEDVEQSYEFVSKKKESYVDTLESNSAKNSLRNSAVDAAVTAAAVVVGDLAGKHSKEANDNGKESKDQNGVVASKSDKGIQKETKVQENSVSKNKNKKEKSGNQVKGSGNKKKEVIWVEVKESGNDKYNNCNNDKISAAQQCLTEECRKCENTQEIQMEIIAHVQEQNCKQDSQNQDICNCVAESIEQLQIKVDDEKKNLLLVEEEQDIHGDHNHVEDLQPQIDIEQAPISEKNNTNLLENEIQVEKYQTNSQNECEIQEKQQQVEEEAVEYCEEFTMDVEFHPIVGKLNQEVRQEVDLQNAMGEIDFEEEHAEIVAGNIEKKVEQEEEESSGVEESAVCVDAGSGQRNQEAEDICDHRTEEKNNAEQAEQEDLVMFSSGARKFESEKQFVITEEEIIQVKQFESGLEEQDKSEQAENGHQQKQCEQQKQEEEEEVEDCEVEITEMQESNKECAEVISKHVQDHSNCQEEKVQEEQVGHAQAAVAAAVEVLKEVKENTLQGQLEEASEHNKTENVGEEIEEPHEVDQDIEFVHECPSSNTEHVERQLLNGQQSNIPFEDEGEEQEIGQQGENEQVIEVQDEEQAVLAQEQKDLDIQDKPAIQQTQQRDIPQIQISRTASVENECGQEQTKASIESNDNTVHQICSINNEPQRNKLELKGYLLDVHSEGGSLNTSMDQYNRGQDNDDMISQTAKTEGGVFRQHRSMFLEEFTSSYINSNPMDHQIIMETDNLMNSQSNTSNFAHSHGYEYLDQSALLGSSVSSQTSQQSSFNPVSFAGYVCNRIMLQTLLKKGHLPSKHSKVVFTSMK